MKKRLVVGMSAVLVLVTLALLAQRPVTVWVLDLRAERLLSTATDGARSLEQLDKKELEGIAQTSEEVLRLDPHNKKALLRLLYLYHALEDVNKSEHVAQLLKNYRMSDPTVAQTLRNYGY